MSPTLMTPEEIKAFRKAMGGINQQELADLLTMSKRSVEDWETGRKAPSPLLGLALAAINARLKPWSEGV